MNTTQRFHSTPLLTATVGAAVIAFALVLYALADYTVPVLVAVGAVNILLSLMCASFAGYAVRNNAGNLDYSTNTFFVIGSFILLVGIFSGMGIGQVLGYGIVGASAFGVLYFLLGNMSMRGVVNRFAR